ncbi:MAG: tetratricopeptide repeat protein [Nitrospirales bacterium]|nr:tetratricopeptide repeat protein [Nitrospirales bacterium]
MKKALILLAAVVIAGCAGSQKEASGLPLEAPDGTPPAAAAAVTSGNGLFAKNQWEQAQAQYEAALKTHPTLAEAHYDLALTLDRLGKKAEATAHYKEAANLAPGNRVIWNAPPFHQHGADVRESIVDKKRPHPDPQRPY